MAAHSEPPAGRIPAGALMLQWSHQQRQRESAEGRMRHSLAGKCRWQPVPTSGRKPFFFNSLQPGFEWNKYNQMR